MVKDAYFAGIIDGEGYIAIAKKNRSGSLRPTISVDMTCELTIRALQAHFGVGTVNTVKRELVNRKQQWRWIAKYDGARFVARKIFPYSITKKTAIQALLSHPKRRESRGMSIKPPSL